MAFTASNMLWVKARSLVGLGATTAIRKGAVGPAGCAGAEVAGASVAAGAQAAKTIVSRIIKPSRRVLLFMSLISILLIVWLARYLKSEVDPLEAAGNSPFKHSLD
jgi:hypothetical protein